MFSQFPRIFKLNGKTLNLPSLDTKHMKFNIEVDLPENKLALALEFLKSLAFVKNVKTLPSKDLPDAVEIKKNEKTDRPFGLLKGTINVPDDFDEPMDDLKEYM
jgi:hypothetical protein